MSNEHLAGALSQVRTDRTASTRTRDEFELMKARLLREKQDASEVHKKRLDDLQAEMNLADENYTRRVADINYSLATVKTSLTNMDRQDDVMSEKRESPPPAPDVEEEMKTHQPTPDPQSEEPEVRA